MELTNIINRRVKKWSVTEGRLKGCSQKLFERVKNCEERYLNANCQDLSDSIESNYDLYRTRHILVKHDKCCSDERTSVFRKVKMSYSEQKAICTEVNERVHKLRMDYEERLTDKSLKYSYLSDEMSLNSFESISHINNDDIAHVLLSQQHSSTNQKADRKSIISSDRTILIEHHPDLPVNLYEKDNTIHTNFSSHNSNNCYLDDSSPDETNFASSNFKEYDNLLSDYSICNSKTQNHCPPKRKCLLGDFNNPENHKTSLLGNYDNSVTNMSCNTSIDLVSERISSGNNEYVLPQKKKPLLEQPVHAANNSRTSFSTYNKECRSFNKGRPLSANFLPRPFSSQIDVDVDSDVITINSSYKSELEENQFSSQNSPEIEQCDSRRYEIDDRTETDVEGINEYEKDIITNHENEKDIKDQSCVPDNCDQWSNNKLYSKTKLHSEDDINFVPVKGSDACRNLFERFGLLQNNSQSTIKENCFAEKNNSSLLINDDVQSYDRPDNNDELASAVLFSGVKDEPKANDEDDDLKTPVESYAYLFDGKPKNFVPILENDYICSK